MVGATYERAAWLSLVIGALALRRRARLREQDATTSP
jgi:hypothetical protein